MPAKVSKAGRYVPLIGHHGQADLSGDEVMQKLYIDGVGDVVLGDNPALAELFAQNNVAAHLTNLTLGEGLPILTSIDIYSENMTELDIQHCPAAYDVSVDAPLTEAAVDAILAALDGFGEEGGKCVLEGQCSIPSAAGLTSKSNLEGKGWTVTVNQ